MTREFHDTRPASWERGWRGPEVASFREGDAIAPPSPKDAPSGQIDRSAAINASPPVALAGKIWQTGTSAGEGAYNGFICGLIAF